MRQEIIDRLLDLSLQAFENQVTPDAFARAAAHEAAHATAHLYCAESADGAALIAATSFLAEANIAACYSAEITDASMQSFAVNRQYRSTRLAFFKEKALPAPRPAPNILFLKLLETPKDSIENAETIIPESYRNAFVHDEAGSEKARRIALYTYTDCYATMRTAFVRSAYFANQQKKDPTAQREVFKTLMSKRLNKDLGYDTLSPGFFLQIMNSRATKIIACILVVAAVTVILLGTYGVLSAPLIPCVIAGAAAATVGVGLLIASLIAHLQQKKLNKTNQQYEAAIVNSPI